MKIHATMAANYDRSSRCISFHFSGLAMMSTATAISKHGFEI